MELKTPPTPEQIRTLVRVTTGIQELHLEASVMGRHELKEPEGLLLDRRLARPNDRTVRNLITEANTALTVGPLAKAS